MTKTELEQAARRAVDWIDAFDRESEEAEHTDTGEAWTVLYRVRSELSIALTLEELSAAVHVERSFLPVDRYKWDREPGLLQVDTKQDASYFGTWIDPDKAAYRELLRGRRYKDDMRHGRGFHGGGSENGGMAEGPRLLARD